MNCCGNKRKEWLNEAKSSTRKKEIENNSYSVITDKPDRVFEYTGNHSLTISGAASRKIYNFKFKGHKIKVDFNDSFSMMAERDLKIFREA